MAKRDTHCSDKCCGSDVKAEDCTCPPTCKHCNCNAKNIKEGLGDLAHRAEMDHEVQMARSDLYKVAKYAIKLHDMLKTVSEAEGIQGWQQAKITKAADYISSVYHSLDYDMKFAESKKVENVLNRKKSDTEQSYLESMATKLAEAKGVCTECGKPALTSQEMKEIAELSEGERHGNSKIYDKCWKGCRKVAGKKRGEPGSCKCD